MTSLSRPFYRMDSIFSVIGSFVDWDVKSLLLFLAVFIITTDYIKNRPPASFPPGPWALPVLGNIFTVDHSRTHESLTEVSQPMTGLVPLVSVVSGSINAQPCFSNLLTVREKTWGCVQPENGLCVGRGVEPVWGSEGSSGDAGRQPGGASWPPSASGNSPQTGWQDIKHPHNFFHRVQNVFINFEELISLFPIRHKLQQREHLEAAEAFCTLNPQKLWICQEVTWACHPGWNYILCRRVHFPKRWVADT